MIPLNQLPAYGKDPALMNTVIDTSKGDRVKYKFDAESGQFRLSKLLPLGATFPFNFGFIPSTRGEDGDALDMLVLMDEPLRIGTVAPILLIGVLKAEQKEKTRIMRNDRLLGVVKTELNPPAFRALKDVQKQCLDEIEHFFISYNQMEGREFKPLGRGGAEEAKKIIKEGEQRYADSFQSQRKTQKRNAAHSS